MKKFLSVIFISMLVLIGAFADVKTGPLNTAGFSSATPSTVDVSLVVDPASMFAYAFGFTNSNSGFDNDLQKNDFTASGIPNAAASPFVLEFNPQSFKATNGGKTLSFYYKIRNNEPVSLTLNISDGLTPTSGDTATQTKVDWTVKATKIVESDGQAFGNETVTLKSDSTGTPQKLSHTINVAQPEPSGQAPNLKYLACGLEIETGTISSLLKQKTTFNGTITLGVTVP